MFKPLLLIFSFVLSITLITSAFAENRNAQPQAAAKKINFAPATPTDRTGGGASDMLGVTKINLGTPSKSKVQFSVGCTDSTGKTLKPKDPGYDQCLTTAQPKPAPGAPGSQTRPSLDLKIGE